jgi:hypothetical protein
MLPTAGAAVAAAAPYVASAGSAILTSEIIRKIKERGANPQDGPITLRHYEESGRQMAAVGQILEGHSEIIVGLQQSAQEADRFQTSVLQHLVASTQRDNEVLMLLRSMRAEFQSQPMQEGVTQYANGQQQFLQVLNEDKNVFSFFEDSRKKYKQDEILALFHRAGELHESHNDPNNQERAKVVGHLCIMASRLLRNDDIQQANQLLATGQTLLALVEHSAVVDPRQPVLSEIQSFSSRSSSENRRPTYADIARGEGTSSYFEAMEESVDYNLLVSEHPQLKKLSEQYGANALLQVLDELNVSEHFTFQELAQVSSRLKKSHEQKESKKKAQLRRRKGKEKAR